MCVCAPVCVCFAHAQTCAAGGRASVRTRKRERTARRGRVLCLTSVCACARAVARSASSAQSRAGARALTRALQRTHEHRSARQRVRVSECASGARTASTTTMVTTNVSVCRNRAVAVRSLCGRRRQVSMTNYFFNKIKNFSYYIYLNVITHHTHSEKFRLFTFQHERVKTWNL